MRMKRDHMGNDQLLPGYNIQCAVCDGFIAAFDVYQYASDMDCFQTLMERFQSLYGQYPEYPVADAGYGSYNNYLYCEEHGMEKFMKFTMYEKESKNEKYFQCEDCSGCPHKEKCCKCKGNRIVRLNEELTQFHAEVLNNLNSIHGALLRMNRSIQSEGTFGTIKWNRSYILARRRGLKSLFLEFGIISCGFNLHKFHLKKVALRSAA